MDKIEKEKVEEKLVFSTRDLYLATTLVSLKFRMTGIDCVVEGSKNRPVGYFKFDDTPELREAKALYSQGLLSLEPKLFVTNLKSLKSDVIGILDNPHMK